MSQRDSGYKRRESDLYETPAWVTEAVMPHLPRRLRVWEPAAGGGKMVSVLSKYHLVKASDLADGLDFLQQKNEFGCTAIITNPPYTSAEEFIEHALRLTKPDGVVAMLLRTDFHHAKTRRHLFSDCPAFAKQLILTKRIKWFEGSKGQPSFNHAWFIWNWLHQGPPTLAYGP